MTSPNCSPLYEACRSPLYHSQHSLVLLLKSSIFPTAVLSTQELAKNFLYHPNILCQPFQFSPLSSWSTWNILTSWLFWKSHSAQQALPAKFLSARASPTNLYSTAKHSTIKLNKINIHSNHIIIKNVINHKLIMSNIIFQITYVCTQFLK